MALSKILKNIFSLTAAEIATKGISFFSFMYLARVLSVEGYGVMSNIISIIIYLMMIVTLGFKDVGIREISGKEHLTQRYFSNITTIKLFLAVIGYLLLIIYLYVNDFPYLVAISFMFGAIQLFANAIQIDWIFIANERMNIIAIRQVLISAITFIGILIFVKSSNDIPLYFLIVSVSLIINNIWLIKFANVKIKLECDILFIKSLLKQSIPLGFIDMLLVIMASFGIVYLAQTSTDEQTGLFASAYKIINFASIPAFILFNVFAPKIAKSNSYFSKIDIAQKYSTIIFVVGAIISAECFTFADFIIRIIFGQEFLPATNLLKILSFNSLCFYIASSVTPLLRYWKQEQKLFIAYFISSTTVVISTIILSYFYNTTGTAIAAILGDIALAIILMIFAFKILHRVLFLKIIPLLAFAFALTTGARMLVNLFTDNIFYLSIAIPISAGIYFLIIIKSKIIVSKTKSSNKKI